MLNIPRRSLIIFTVAIIIIFTVIGGMTLLIKFTGKTEIMNIPAETTAEIEIKCKNATVFVSATDRDDIKITSSKAKNLEVKTFNGKIIIDQESRKLGVSFLELEVPASWCGSMSASTVNGNVSISGLTSDTISSSVVTGDIEVFSTSANSLNASSVTGDINLHENEIAKTSIANTVTGSIDLIDHNSDTISLSVVTGDASITDGIYNSASIDLFTGKISVYTLSQNSQINYYSDVGSVDIYDNIYDETKGTIITGNGNPILNLELTTGSITVSTLN